MAVKQRSINQHPETTVPSITVNTTRNERTSESTGQSSDHNFHPSRRLFRGSGIITCSKEQIYLPAHHVSRKSSENFGVIMHRDKRIKKNNKNVRITMIIIYMVLYSLKWSEGLVHHNDCCNLCKELTVS